MLHFDLQYSNCNITNVVIGTKCNNLKGQDCFHKYNMTIGMHTFVKLQFNHGNN